MLREILEHEDGTVAMINRCLEVVRNSNGIVAFGAGVGGAALYNLLKDNGLSSKILCYTDNNSLKFGRSYCEDRIIILQPDKLISTYGKDITILITSSAYDILRNQLIEYGYSENNIHLFNFAFMDLDYTDSRFIFDHIEDFERAYERLGDDKSRRIFKNILNYRITKDDIFLQQMQPDVEDEHYQYFDRTLFGFKQDEVFLDIGAYLGDTLQVFLEMYKEYEQYIGFEADEIVFEKLQQIIAKHGVKDKAKIYNYAAWNSQEKLYFDVNPGSSKMNAKGTTVGKTKVMGIAVDDVLQNKKITFVKMDIEGAEYNALSGMKHIIKKNTPLLAICVYHLRDDFYKLTDLVESILPNEYKYYFRQYRYTPTETVCYMVPRHRCLQ